MSSSFSLPKGVQPERTFWMNDKTLNQHKEYILYWMQSSMRVSFNHSLEVAIAAANFYEKPLLVICTLIDSTVPIESSDMEHIKNERHMAFLLEGLLDVQDDLKKRGIKLLLSKCTLKNPPISVVKLVSENALLLVADHSNLKLFRQWNVELARIVSCPMVQVESDVIVPVQIASDKEEYAARTIRPKIEKHLKKYLIPLPEVDLFNKGTLIPTLKEDKTIEWIDLSNDEIKDILLKLGCDTTVPWVSSFKGGSKEAEKVLEIFLEKKFFQYDEKRNEPSGDGCSNLSPYLRYGHISPIKIVLRVHKIQSKSIYNSRKVFLEELIVRRELAANFTYYSNCYDSFSSLPNYAQQTLEAHTSDKRKYVYSKEELEKGNTHDKYWNMAQLEMIATGKMSNYMRMYWGKKIIEWTKTPQIAFDIALDLNNKYELDAPDPNSYAGIAWIFGKHDQGWKEREIFGKVRYMNDKGLERKFNMSQYVNKIQRICKDIPWMKSYNIKRPASLHSFPIRMVKKIKH